MMFAMLSLSAGRFAELASPGLFTSLVSMGLGPSFGRARLEPYRAISADRGGTSAVGVNASFLGNGRVLQDPGAGGGGMRAAAAAETTGNAPAFPAETDMALRSRTAVSRRDHPPQSLSSSVVRPVLVS